MNAGIGRAVLLLAAWSAALGCASRRGIEEDVRTQVSVEGGSDRVAAGPSRGPASWASRMYPPRYFQEILPDYPQRALESRLPPIRVRVDLVVGADGRPHDLRVSVLDESPWSASFAEASLAAAQAWRFSPAWRLASDSRAEEPIIALAYHAHLVFRFEVLESGAAATVRMSSGED